MSVAFTLSRAESTVKTSFWPPKCQNFRSASRWPEAVTVTFSGYSDRPSESRLTRRSSELTSSLGLSFRMVVAPIRIASQEARTSSTRSKSSALESSSGSGLASSR